MGLLNRGATFLAGKFKNYEARTVTYRRDRFSVTLSAMPAQTLLQLVDAEGNISMVWTDRDFIITAADLILNSAVTLPQRGDTIEDTIAGDAQTFVVLPYGSDPVWKPCDEFGIAIRIHTKRKS